MSALPTSLAPSASAGAAAIPGWRYAMVVFGVALGLSCSFPVLFNASLPFFLLPLTQEFGWGRGDTSAATVLAMLGVTLASPFVGRLVDRVGPERAIGVSVVLFSAGVYAMSKLPASLAALGALCLCIGVAGCATTMVGYASVLPRWFDRRLGLALGFAGLGVGIGIGLVPFVTNRLIAEFGWRGAYVSLAAIGLVAGIAGFVLLRPRGAAEPPLATARDPRVPAAVAEGLSLKEAARETRFWLLLGVTFFIPFSILGIALHGAALFMDRGLTGQQAAAGAALAGLGAIAARVGIGALLDSFSAPLVAAVIFLAGGVGLFINSWAASFALLSIGTFLGGATMGAEGDLLPFMLRRYFGLRAFGAIFGSMHSAYALGGVLGPIAFGYTYDRMGSYAPIMVPCGVVCVLCALVVAWMGPYRYRAS